MSCFRLWSLKVLLVQTVATPSLLNAANAERLPWTLDCVEVVHASANHSLTNYTLGRDPQFKLTFSQIEEGKFVLTGNAGSSPLVASVGIGFVVLLEQTGSGNITATTILTKPDDGGNYRAVHSRNTVIGDQLVPSQTILTCKGR